MTTVMDPLSIAASATALELTCNQIISLTESIAHDKVPDSDLTIAGLAPELQNVISLLDEINTTWGSHSASLMMHPSAGLGMWPSVQNILKRCEITLQRLEEKISLIVNSGRKRTFLKGLAKAWTLGWHSRVIQTHRDCLVCHTAALRVSVHIMRMCMQGGKPERDGKSGLSALQTEIKSFEFTIEKARKLSFVSRKEEAERNGSLVCMDGMAKSAKSFYQFIATASPRPAGREENNRGTAPPPPYTQAMQSGSNSNTNDGPRSSPYCIAARTGNLNEIKRLVSIGADVLATDETGQSPAFLAAVSGHTDVLKLLIDHGADYTSRNKHGYTPLNAAATYGHSDAVQLLIEHGADPSQPTLEGQTPIFASAKAGFVDCVRVLLENGVDKSAGINPGNWSPLHASALANQEGVVKYLCEQGAEVNSSSWDGRTPLLCAADKGHSEVVRILLYHDANANVVANSGSTPLYAAARRGYVGIVRALLYDGADLNSGTRDPDWLPLMAAVEKGHLDIVKLLLEKGADYTIRNSSGRTPLRLAAARGYTEIVQVLLDQGADIEA